MCEDFGTEEYFRFLRRYKWFLILHKWFPNGSRSPVLCLLYISFSYPSPSFPLRMVQLYICRVTWNREEFSQAASVFVLEAVFIELWGPASLTSPRHIKAWPRARSSLFLVIKAELESRFSDSQSSFCFYPLGCPLAFCVWFLCAIAHQMLDTCGLHSCLKCCRKAV